MTSPTPAELQEMRALAEKATKGPWQAEISGRGLPCVVSEDTWICGELSNGNGELPEEGANNAAFIAAAHPQRVIEIIDALVSARAALRKYGNHLYECRLKHGGDRCNCGLARAHLGGQDRKEGCPRCGLADRRDCQLEECRIEMMQEGR